MKQIMITVSAPLHCVIQYFMVLIFIGVLKLSMQ